ncbi:MAG: bifunctional methylenetetrahydrofolate dehydrogenase/methenyltetrahydrofolate cyclohydrolase FolD [Deltaproteobacteria bacterium]|nr:bifunctional methylenetetrahydrofolate dehydrogenase/methenyltetrahydrofolate cyclohydrolase FolD [Deltaproteobacteria bacterium]
MPTVLDGKALAQRVKTKLAADVKEFIQKTGVTPKLCVLRAGDDPASEVYVRNKAKACGEVGITSEVVHKPETNEQEVLAIVKRWDDDASVSGILVQLPLPKGIDERKVLELIDPNKDVDAFHPHHAGLLSQGRATLTPCTPRGCLALIHEAQKDITGLHAVVIGRSNIVGKPVAQLLLNANATVTVCHSKTKDLPAIVKQADIIVAAIGKAGFVKGDWVKPGAIVIDVGINRGQDGKLTGDVDYAAAAERAKAITPVPGGVGPMTIAMLLENTLTCARIQKHQ